MQSSGLAEREARVQSVKIKIGEGISRFPKEEKRQ